jgi:hypothetical protein
MPGPRCFFLVGSLILKSLSPKMVFLSYQFVNFAGELERIFLVLREKVALRRIHALDEQPNPNQNPNMPEEAPAGGPPPSANVEDAPGRPRGEKRRASDDPLSPSKRPAI